MSTVTGMTAARMLAIEAATVVDGEFDGSGHLILTTHDGTEIDAGSPSSIPAASDTAQGVVELATSVETSALTDLTRAVTPGGLATVMGTKSGTSHTHAFSVLTGTATNAQLANMAANTIKANNTGFAAAPADITVAQLRTMIDPGWTTWASMQLKGDTTNPTIGAGSTLAGQYRLYDGMIDLDAQLTVGSGWSNGSGFYYLTLPVSKVAVDAKFSIGTGIIIAAAGTGIPAIVTMDTATKTKLYLAVQTPGSVGSGWTVASGDQFRWHMRGIRVT